MKVFLVILHDRHRDDEITAYASLGSAVAGVKVAQLRYGILTWKRGEAKPSVADRERTKAWVQHWETTEDGPWIHVEEHEVKP